MGAATAINLLGNDLRDQLIEQEPGGHCTRDARIKVIAIPCIIFTFVGGIVMAFYSVTDVSEDKSLTILMIRAIIFIMFAILGPVSVARIVRNAERGVHPPMIEF